MLLIFLAALKKSKNKQNKNRIIILVMNNITNKTTYLKRYKKLSFLKNKSIMIIYNSI